MAQGGAKAEAEIQRLITEKVAALAEAQVAATVAAFKGSKKHRVAKKALGVYGFVTIGAGSQSKGTGAARPRTCADLVPFLPYEWPNQAVPPAFYVTKGPPAVRLVNAIS